MANIYKNEKTSLTTTDLQLYIQCHQTQELLLSLY